MNACPTDLGQVIDFDPEPPPPALETINGKPAIRLPGDDRLLSQFAADIGSALSGAGIFDRQGMAFRLDPKTQTLAPVSKDWLRSWCEDHLTPYKYSGKRGEVKVKHSMSKDAAEAVISSAQFLAKLPKVERIHPCPMPWLRQDGSIDLLDAGLDQESGTYTLDPGFTIDPMTLAEAREVLESVLEEFCFADDGGRSKAVAIAAMLTVFASGIMPQRSLKPVFVYIANAEGSGKTTLAMLAGLPYRETAAEPAPADENEWRKKILSAVISGRRLLLLDNLKGRLNSPTLEAYTTSSAFTDRILGASREFTGEAGAAILITGNGLQWTPDLRRRSLAVELFMREMRAEDRRFKRALTPSTLPRIRRRVLCSLWSLVAAWDQAGRPKASGNNSSFPEWCESIAGVVEFAGWKCPASAPSLEGMGDTDTADFTTLVAAMQPARDYSFSDLIDLAAEIGVFENLANEIKNSGKNAQSARAAMSSILKRYNGRRVTAAHYFAMKGKGHSRCYLLHG